jgi:hypothetical protein
MVRETKPRTTRESEDRSHAQALLPKYLFLIDFRATDENLYETVSAVGAIHRAPWPAGCIVWGGKTGKVLEPCAVVLWNS